jgi:hypothetical protein
VVFAETPAEGTYRVFVRNYSARAAGPFTIDVVAGDRTLQFSGELPRTDGADSEAFTFTWPLPEPTPIDCRDAGTCAEGEVCLFGGEDCRCDDATGMRALVSRADACVAIPEACMDAAGTERAECIAGTALGRLSRPRRSRRSPRRRRWRPTRRCSRSRRTRRRSPGS